MRALRLRAAGARAAKTQITLINGWGDSSLDGDRIQELYARFNEENDDIQLNFLTLANTEAVVKVAEDMLVVGRRRISSQSAAARRSSSTATLWKTAARWI